MVVVSLAALLVSWYWQYGDKHCHAANTDHAIMITTYNSITVLSPSLKSLFVQLFSPLVDPPVRSFLSRRVS